MKSKLVFWVASCLLLSVLSAQWLEKTVLLPDSLGSVTNPTALCVNTADNTVFVGGGGDRVIVLDGITNRRIAAIPVPGGVGRMCYNPVQNRVYCVNNSVPCIYVIDAAANTLSDSITVGDDIMDICYAPNVNEVYCARESDTVVAVDCSADTVVAVIPLWAEPLQLCAAPGANKVYCGMYSADRSAIVSIDCSTHTVIDSAHVVDIWVTDMAYNPVANKLYVDWGEFGSVIIVDCVNDSVLNWANAPEGDGRLAVDTADNKVYVSGNYDGWVSVISGATNNVIATIDTLDVAALVWDATDNVVFGVDDYGRQLAAIDCRADTLMGLTSIPGYPDSLRWNPVSNRLYLTSGDDVVVVDAASRQVIDRLPMWFDIGQLAWDSHHNRLYAGGQNMLASIDLPANEVRRFIPLPATPQALLYHSERDRLYCGTGAGIAVVDCAGDSLLRIIPGTDDCRTLCLNVVRDKLYSLHTYGRELLMVTDCAGDTVTTRLSFNQGRVDTFAYSRASDRLFCTRRNGPAVMVDGAGDSIVGGIPFQNDAHALCHIPDGDMLACSNRWNLSVQAADCASGQLVSYAQLYYDPYALGYSGHSRKLYSFEYTGGHVTILDIPSLQPLGTMWLTGQVVSQAYDSIADRLALGLDQNVPEVRFVDCGLDSFVGRVALPGIPGSMVRGGDRRLYVANWDNSSYSVIRDTSTVGVAEVTNDERGVMSAGTVVRGILVLPASSVMRDAASVLLDISGRKVLDLAPGPNDVRGLAPGVYFVRVAQAQAQAQATRKVIITR